MSQHHAGQSSRMVKHTAVAALLLFCLASAVSARRDGARYLHRRALARAEVHTGHVVGNVKVVPARHAVRRALQSNSSDAQGAQVVIAALDASAGTMGCWKVSIWHRPETAPGQHLFQPSCNLPTCPHKRLGRAMPSTADAAALYSAGCRDNYSFCEVWAKLDFCKGNTTYQGKCIATHWCPKSCNTCAAAKPAVATRKRSQARSAPAASARIEVNKTAAAGECSRRCRRYCMHVQCCMPCPWLNV